MTTAHPPGTALETAGTAGTRDGGSGVPPGGSPNSGRLLDVDGLAVAFRTDDGPLRAVDGVSFHVDRGETLALVGESGSGKSVTAMSLMGLLPRRTTTMTGSVRFDGTELVGASKRTWRDVRGRRIAMVFQDPMTSLNPVLRIGDQIGESLKAHGRVPSGGVDAEVVALLDRVGIPDASRRARSFPHEMSGGMRQRVMIAMAMACGPDLLIADEPTTALDVTIQAQVLDVLDHLRAEAGLAMLLITHDLGVVAGRADRVHVMYAGRLVEQATTDELFASPRMPYTAGLLGATPRLDASSEPVAIPGSPPNLVMLGSGDLAGCAFAPRCARRDDTCAQRPELVDVAPGHRAACHHPISGATR